MRSADISGKQLRYCALSLFVLAGTATAVSARPAYVPATVNLRAAPGTGSQIVSKIPSGSLIDADNCTEGWCAVTWQGKSGFAKETALDTSGRVPSRAAQLPAVQRRVSAAEPGEEVYADGPDDAVEAPPPVYYEPRPYYYYGYVPYYYRGWGWRHRW